MRDKVMEVLKKRGVKVPNDVLLFIYGVKSACALTSGYGGLVLAFQSFYPSIGMQRSPGVGTVIFFQDAKVMKKFIDNGLNFVSGSGREYLDYNHGELGKILGYPPQSL